MCRLVSVSDLPCISLVDGKLLPVTAFFFLSRGSRKQNQGTFFFDFLGPESVAIFRPHLQWNGRHKRPKRGPFSGPRNRDQKLDFFLVSASFVCRFQGLRETAKNHRHFLETTRTGLLLSLSRQVGLLGVVEEARRRPGHHHTSAASQIVG